MIGDGGEAVRAQDFGKGLGVFAGLAIDDAGVQRPGFCEIADLVGGAGFCDDLVFQVRPVEAGEENGGVLQLQLF